MTSVPGGTAFVPTEEKLDDILFRLMQVNATSWDPHDPDTLAIAPFYKDALGYGGGAATSCHGACSTRVLEKKDRYLPRRRVSEAPSRSRPDTDSLTEYAKHSWYSSPRV